VVVRRVNKSGPRPTSEDSTKRNKSERNKNGPKLLEFSLAFGSEFHSFGHGSKTLDCPLEEFDRETGVLSLYLPRGGPSLCIQG
jgi:hypothetical protein